MSYCNILDKFSLKVLYPLYTLLRTLEENSISHKEFFDYVRERKKNKIVSTKDG